LREAKTYVQKDKKKAQHFQKRFQITTTELVFNVKIAFLCKIVKVTLQQLPKQFD
jgi:hypothetical protein